MTSANIAKAALRSFELGYRVATIVLLATDRELAGLVPVPCIAIVGAASVTSVTIVHVASFATDCGLVGLVPCIVGAAIMRACDTCRGKTFETFYTAISIQMVGLAQNFMTSEP